jgi:hydrogenase maturation protease
MKKVMVLGVGNQLMTDEGLGPYVITELQKEQWPENVELIEGGTAGLEILYLIEGVDFLIIVDAIDARTDPGSIFKFKPNDISVFPEEFGFSFHQVGLFEVLQMAMVMEKLPETIIFGMQPRSLDWGMELSPEVQTKIPELIKLVKEEIKSNLK